MRAGAKEQGFAKSWKECHKASLLTATSKKQRRFSLLFPDASVAKDVEGKMGEFQDLRLKVRFGNEEKQKG